jgi:dihydrofolate reductase
LSSSTGHELALIVAASLNGVIGDKGDLPWHIPEDLKYFRRNTVGHAIIMGRRTYESIGRPLPKRRNIVVSRQTGLSIPGCEVTHSLEEALKRAWENDTEPRIIGGATLYTQAFPLATRLFLTEVQQTIEGDTHFPSWDRNQWTLLSSTQGDGVVFQQWTRNTGDAR